MPRFFVPSSGFDGDLVKISGDDAFHIARSLRMAVGDELTVCDMHGAQHTCRLTRIRDDECECEILATEEGKTEPPVEITLFMGYPKGDKLETVIQKAVELGASKITPFESSRCIKRPKADRAEKQLLRFSRIAEEAAKQCGRSRLPTVDGALSFSEMLAEAAKHDVTLFCYEGDGARSLKDVLSELGEVKTVAVVVGSEGGFSLDEARKAGESGAVIVNLGPRILRCETAPAFVLSALTYHFEL